ncbi:hypothetical protein [Tenacibaculum ascidiaceicola]|uniref:hypothetical protein n=1 Tax=Tenacibaculum ascidiaceicola TaxID=1699411 RepID=UPI0038934C1B
MKTKFEKLSDELFKYKLDKNQTSEIRGGIQITYEKYETFIGGENGDYVECGTDYRGKTCDPVVFY